MHLESIHRYPLKSGTQQELHSATIESRGIVGDRRWMVVGADGHFHTARTMPALLRIELLIEGDEGVVLTVPGSPSIEITGSSRAPVWPVRVWGDRCDALSVSGDADEALSAYLGQEVRLVFMPDATRRPVDPNRSRPGDIVSFADGFPLLLTTNESLNDLNDRMANSVTMRRFRPNLVIAGAEPYAELDWRRIQIGQLEFETGGPCTRCSLVTIKPESAQRDHTGEPLRTLAQYQRRAEGVVFGVNLIPRSLGVVSVGDTVRILE